MINPVQDRLAGRRVLVVEDDWFDAMEATKLLLTAGADVVGPVATLRDAMRLAADAQALDAALLDICLADGLVFTAADLLLRRNIPFVFVTGYAPRDLVRSYAGVPCHGKPCDCVALVKCLLTE